MTTIDPTSEPAAAAPAPAPTPAPAHRQRAAFVAMQGELQALGSEGLPRINLDVRQAVVTVLGCLPEIQALAPRLAAEAPAVDPQLFTKLEQYALALGHAHTQFLATSQPTEPVTELTETLREHVDRFQVDAGALARRGLLDGGRLALLAGTNGAKNTAASALLLTELLRAAWSRIEGKTPVTLAELDVAETLANRLETSIGLRDQAPSGAPEAAMARLKMHGLFIRTYDEVRRVVSFLRWHEGDVDRIAPSLYLSRGRRSSSTEVPAEDAAANGATSGTAGPATGADPTNANGKAPPGVAPVPTPGAPGSPFIDG